MPLYACSETYGRAGPLSACVIHLGHGFKGNREFHVPPTVLYAIGLPIAEDFAGRARTEIFTEAFRSAHPLLTIPTWGKPVEGENRASDVDGELLDQLRALGYIE